MMDSGAVIEAARKAMAVQGLISEEEAAWLASMAFDKKLIIEVGSWKGRSAVAMAAISNARIICIDDWRGPRARPLDEAKQREVFTAFCMNTFEWMAKGRIIPLVGDSWKILDMILEHFGPGRVDMFFIDGDHSYEGVKRDIERAIPLLRPGGLLAGDDDYEDYPGVTKAIHELIPDHHKQPPKFWWWVKPE